MPVYVTRRMFQTVSILLGLLLAGMAMAEERPVKISTMNYHPLLFTNQHGEFTGTVGNTVKALCVAAGIDCDFFHLPLKRSILMLNQGKLDATITIDTGRPRECCIRSIWHSPWSAGFYSRLPAGDVPKVDTDLLGLSLIVINGMKSPYSFAPRLGEWEASQVLAVTHATNIHNAVRMFLSGRAELLWGSDDFEYRFKAQNQGRVPPFYARATYPIVVWVGKHRPKLRQALDDGYKILAAQGTLNAKNLLPYQIDNGN